MKMNEKKSCAAGACRTVNLKRPAHRAGPPHKKITTYIAPLAPPAKRGRQHALSVIITTIFMILFSAPAYPAEVLPLKTLIAKIQETYEKTKDLKASFLQEVTMKSMNRTEKEEGVFYFKKPQKMVWDYLKPKKKKLVINPHNTWFHLPDDRVVYLQDTESVLKSKLTIKFLSGLGNLQEDFQVSFPQSDPLDEEGNYLLRLVPRGADIGMENLSLCIDKDSFQVVQFGFSDTYGNTSRIRFRNVMINGGLPDTLFNFKTPPGTEVFHMP